MTKETAIIDPAEIDIKIISTVERNTLPAFVARLDAELATYRPEELNTDEDFAWARKQTKALKDAEDRLAEIYRQLFTGETAQVMHSVAAAQEKIRAKRLELARAIDSRDKALLESAILDARLSLEAELKRLPHARPVDIEQRLRQAVKGKRTIASKNEALEDCINEILDAEAAHDRAFEQQLEATAAAFDQLNEPAAPAEIEMLVKTYGENAPERARLIIENRRIEKEKQKLAAERRAKEEAERRAKEQAEAEAARQQAAAKAPERQNPTADPQPPAQAAPIQTPPAKAAETAAPEQKRQFRFAVTFTVADPQKVMAWLARANGQDIHYKPWPTQKDLGWANGWDKTPDVVEHCHKQGHKVKSEETGRCTHRYHCDICGYAYMVDSSD